MINHYNRIVKMLTIKSVPQIKHVDSIFLYSWITVDNIPYIAVHSKKPIEVEIQTGPNTIIENSLGEPINYNNTLILDENIKIFKNTKYINISY